MPTILMYSTKTCPFCIQAEHLLNRRGVQVEKILVDVDTSQLRNMIKITNRRTVPQIFIGDYHVGGYDDLVALDIEGKLEPLLKAD
jgi:glutaredoxin 3